MYCICCSWFSLYVGSFLIHQICATDSRSSTAPINQQMNVVAESATTQPVPAVVNTQSPYSRGNATSFLFSAEPISVSSDNTTIIQQVQSAPACLLNSSSYQSNYRQLLSTVDSDARATASSLTSPDCSDSASTMKCFNTKTKCTSPFSKPAAEVRFTTTYTLVANTGRWALEVQLKPDSDFREDSGMF